MNVNYKLNLDVYKDKAYESITVAQNDDKSRIIECRLYADSQPVTLPSNVFAAFNATVDNVIVAENVPCTVADNTVKITLAKSMLQLAGMMQCELVLSDNDTILTTQHFSVYVNKSVINSKSKYEPLSNQTLATKADVAKVKTDTDIALSEKLPLTKTDNILTIKTGVYNLNNGIVIAIDDNQLITVSGTATAKSYFNLLDMINYAYTGDLPSENVYTDNNYYVSTFDTDENSATYFVKNSEYCNYYYMNKSAQFSKCSALGFAFTSVGKEYNFSVRFQITAEKVYDDYIPTRAIPDLYKNELLKISKKVNLIKFDKFTQHFDNGDLTVTANGSHISISSTAATTSAYGITIPILPFNFTAGKKYTISVQNLAIASYEGNVTNIALKSSKGNIKDINGKTILVGGYTYNANYPTVATAEFAEQSVLYVYLWLSKGNTINTDFDLQCEEGSESSVIIDSVKTTVDKAIYNAFTESKLTSIAINVPVINADNSRDFNVSKRDVFNYPPMLCFGGEYLMHWYQKIYDGTNSVVIDLEGDSITEGYNSENSSDDAFKNMRAFALKRIMKNGNYPLNKLSIINNGRGSRSTNEWVGTQQNYYYDSDKTDYPNGIIDDGSVSTADLIICAYGENDAIMGVNQINKSVNVTLYDRLQIFENNYREALHRIRGVQSVNGRPAYGRSVSDCSIILCVPTCASDRGQRYLQNWHQYVREIIFKLASEFSCAVCDFTAVTARWSNPDYTDWSTYNSSDKKTAIHPNKAATMYYTSALAELVYPICLHNITIEEE